MALALAEAGADIVAIDVESLAAVSHAVTDRGVRCATRELDLQALTPDDAADLIAWSRSRFEDLSVLVNNAGMIRRAPAAETSAEDWHDVIGLNLTTPFFLAQAFANRLFRALANEWTVHGIRVNGIAPGWMSTDLTVPLREDSARDEALLARMPITGCCTSWPSPARRAWR
jgi:2-deoxy-D-gluconate 3-dehydrogenase